MPDQKDNIMNSMTEQRQQVRVIIAGGGTGGHVFPAIAVASAISNKIAGASILFVGAANRMEMKMVPRAGYHIIGLDIAGLQRTMTIKNLLLPLKLCKSLRAARKIIKKFKPDLAIGFGGYASGPLLWAAAKQKVPILIQEQNSLPGLTNRILAKKAIKICVASEGMEKYLPKQKIELTGNPVREEVINIEGKRSEAFKYFGLYNNKPVLLVTGGSLGARTINQSIETHISNLTDKGIQVIWQTGKNYFEQAKKIKDSLKTNQVVIIKEFISRMDLAYAAADIVVSRAGAITVSEICAIRKPAILVPSPNVAEDHQTKNAMTLVNKHAAVVVNDNDATKQLGKAIADLIFNEEKKNEMKKNIAGLSFTNAAETIADIGLSIIRQQPA